MARAVAQGRLAGHQGTLSTRAHAESESQQGKVTPCYPAGRCIRPWIGRGRVAPRSLFSHQPSCAWKTEPFRCDHELGVRPMRVVQASAPSTFRRCTLVLHIEDLHSLNI